MSRRSLSAYEKFLLAQAHDTQNGGALLGEEAEQQTEAALKPSAAVQVEEEKRLSESNQLAVSSTPPTSSSLATHAAAAPTARLHFDRSIDDDNEQKEPAAAVTSKAAQQQQRQDQEEDEADGIADENAEDKYDGETYDDEQFEGEADEQQYRHSRRRFQGSDERYTGADELGLLDDVDSLPIDGISPLPVDKDDDEEAAEVNDQTVLQDDEAESVADTLSPLPHHTHNKDDDDDAASEHQLEPHSAASESSVDVDLDDKIHAHKAALSHYTLQPTVHSHTIAAANADDANLLSTVREGNEDDEHSNRTGGSSTASAASAHRWFTDLVNRPSFLSPNSPTAAPSRFSLSSQHSSPNDHPLHSRKRSSLPSPLPSGSRPSISDSHHSSSFHHPQYNSPSAFFAAKSGQLGSLSGSRSGSRPSFSTPLVDNNAAAVGGLGSPMAVGRLSFTPFRRSDGVEVQDEQRIDERDERQERSWRERVDEEVREEDEKINRSLTFHSPNRPPHSTPQQPRSSHRASLPPRPPSSYPTTPSTTHPTTTHTVPPANLHLLPSTNLRHCHLFLHFHSTLPHDTLAPLVGSTLRRYVTAEELYSSLTDKGSGRWVMMWVLEGDGQWVRGGGGGWCEGVESVLVGYGMSGLDFVVLLPPS